MVDKSEKFNWLVRVGYFSRAILYSVLGLIALTSALAPAAAWTPTQMSGLGLDRRSMLKIPAGVALGVGLPALKPKDANAVVYFDPAMYVHSTARECLAEE